MSKDHKRPLYAFVILVLACTVVMAHGLRTEALQGWLRVPAATVVAGVELTRIVEPDSALADLAPAPAGDSLVAAPDTGTEESTPPTRGGKARGRGTASLGDTPAPSGAAPVSAPAAQAGGSGAAPATKSPGRPDRGRHGGRKPLPVAAAPAAPKTDQDDAGHGPGRGWSRGWGTRPAQAQSMSSGWERDRDDDRDWDEFRDEAGPWSHAASRSGDRASWGTQDRPGWAGSPQRDWR